MSDKPTPITITILDKEYSIGCLDSEQEALQSAARNLDHRMREIRDSGKVVGSERIAVITALNLASELLKNNEQREGFTKDINAGISRIASKVGSVLQDDFPAETA